MIYGRTLVELFLVQLLILSFFMLAPVDLITTLDTVIGWLVSSLAGGSLAYVLYQRHRSRASGQARSAQPASRPVVA